MASKNFFFFLLFIAMIAWGGSWVNVKVMSGYVGAFDMIFIRYFLTSLSMVPLLFVLKKSFRIDLRGVGFVLASSAVLIAYMVYFFLGAKHGTASLGGALVTSLIPINTFLILALMRARKVGRKNSVALTLGALGVLTMLNVWKFDLSQILVIQNLYFLLAAILWPILTIISSKATHLSPVVFTFYMYVVVTIVVGLLFVDFNTIAYEKLDGIFWTNTLLMAFAATTFANTVYFLGIERLGAGEVSSFIFLVPFSAIGLSALFLDEVISVSMIMGVLMTLYAVKLLNNITFFKKR
jgi:drug/metabolite transporter (DMT)-like permease